MKVVIALSSFVDERAMITTLISSLTNSELLRNRTKKQIGYLMTYVI